jgi:hypothetical protein
VRCRGSHAQGLEWLMPLIPRRTWPASERRALAGRLPPLLAAAAPLSPRCASAKHKRGARTSTSNTRPLPLGPLPAPAASRRIASHRIASVHVATLPQAKREPERWEVFEHSSDELVSIAGAAGRSVPRAQCVYGIPAAPEGGTAPTAASCASQPCNARASSAFLPAASGNQRGAVARCSSPHCPGSRAARVANVHKGKVRRAKACGRQRLWAQRLPGPAAGAGRSVCFARHLQRVQGCAERSRISMKAKQGGVKDRCGSRRRCANNELKAKASARLARHSAARHLACAACCWAHL